MLKIVLGLVAVLAIIGAGTAVCLTGSESPEMDDTSTNKPPLTMSQKIDMLQERVDALITQMQTYEYKISQLQKSLDAAYSRIAELEKGK